MTLYIVRAKPKNDLSGLRKELESGKISKLRPFGDSLHHGLQNARFDTSNNYVMWGRRRLLFSTISNGKRKRARQIF
jgi:hypothetical protein